MCFLIKESIKALVYLTKSCILFGEKHKTPYLTTEECQVTITPVPIVK